MSLIKWLLFLLFPFSLCAKEDHPITRINQWFKEEKELTEGRFSKFAMLATVSADGHPHTHMIEISKLNPKEGAIFFTHQKSEEAGHIAFHPYGALNLWLPRIRRQVSIEGSITQVSQDIAEKAWNRMPQFKKNRHLQQEKTPQEPLPCPSSFIGYQLTPVRIIFHENPKRNLPKKEVALLINNQWNFESHL